MERHHSLGVSTLVALMATDCALRQVCCASGREHAPRRGIAEAGTGREDGRAPHSAPEAMAEACDGGTPGFWSSVSRPRAAE